MQATNETPTASIPPLLALPREVRNLIYDALLVHDVIDIGTGVASIPGLLSRSSIARFKEKIRDEYYELRRPCESRSPWEVPGSGVFSSGQFYRAKKLMVPVTYQCVFRRSGVLRLDGSLNVQIMSVCRQLYYEARETFYTKNAFRFPNTLCIPAAFHFVHDRSEESLSYIRSMTLVLTEEFGVARPPNHSYPDPRPSDPYEPILLYAYGYYEKLCAFISKEMQLQHFVLHLESLSGQPLARINTIEDCLNAKRIPLVPPSWLEPLLAIENLETITIRSLFCNPSLLRHARIAEAMRENMLKNSSKLNGIETQNLDSIDIHLRLNIACSGLLSFYPGGVDFALRCDVAAGEFDWRPCKLRLHWDKATEVELKDTGVGSGQGNMGNTELENDNGYSDDEEPNLRPGPLYKYHVGEVVCYTVLKSQ